MGKRGLALILIVGLPLSAPAHAKYLITQKGNHNQGRRLALNRVPKTKLAGLNPAVLVFSRTNAPAAHFAAPSAPSNASASVKQSAAATKIRHPRKHAMPVNRRHSIGLALPGASKEAWNRKKDRPRTIPAADSRRKKTSVAGRPVPMAAHAKQVFSRPTPGRSRQFFDGGRRQAENAVDTQGREPAHFHSPLLWAAGAGALAAETPLVPSPDQADAAITYTSWFGEALSPILEPLHRSGVFEAGVYIPAMSVIGLAVFFLIKNKIQLSESLGRTMRRLWLAHYASIAWLAAVSFAVGLKTLIVEQLDYSERLWFDPYVGPLHFLITAVSAAYLWLATRKIGSPLPALASLFVHAGLFGGGIIAILRILSEPLGGALGGLLMLAWFLLSLIDLAARRPKRL